jgi:peptidoglycan/LPS O-acetylase OafA/YrhL
MVSDGGFRYQPGLDGLRAVAVVAVLLFHAEFDWAQGGFLGVSAFFTLSGFLITTLLLGEFRSNGSVRIGAFLGRRARRLLPAAFCGIVLASVYIAFVAPGELAEPFRLDGLAALFDVANWRFAATGDGYLTSFASATGVSVPQSPVLHFWSLAIEEQFYLVFPIVFVGCARAFRGRRAALGALLVAMTLASVVIGAQLSSDGDTSRAYFGTDSRAAELLVGALLAVALDGRLARVARSHAVVGWAGLVALGGLVALWSVADHEAVWLFRGGLVAHAGVVAFVIVAAMAPGPSRGLLSTRPLVWLGKISYGVYVFHWPVYQWIDANRTGLDPFALFALRMAFTLALATVSYRLIEQPIRHGRARRTLRRIAGPAWLATAAAILAAALVAPAPTTVFTSVADRDPNLPLTPTDRDVLAIDRDVPTMPQMATSPLGPAAEGTRPERVLVVGDSVALTLGRGVERWGLDHDVAVWNLGRKMCGIPRAPVQVGFEEIRSPSCERWPAMWAAAIDGFDPDVVIVLSPIWDAMPHRAPSWRRMRSIGDPVYDRWLFGEYRQAVSVLGSRGARVVWLDAPCGEGRPLSAAAADLNRVIRRLTRLDVDVISIARPLCAARGAWGDSRDLDGYHFSDPGADLVASWLMGRLVGR